MAARVRKRKKPIIPKSNRARRDKAAVTILRGRAEDRGFTLSKAIEGEGLESPYVSAVGYLYDPIWIGPGWRFHKRRMEEYAYRLHFKPMQRKTAIMEILRRKMREKKGKVRILDSGSGENLFLIDVSESVSPEERKMLELEGLTLARRLRPKQAEEATEKAAGIEPTGYRHSHAEEDKKSIRKHRVKDMRRVERDSEAYWQKVKEHQLKVHTGLAETHRHRKKYDLIFSTEQMLHAINPEKALFNLLSQLAPRGEAYINFNFKKDSLENNETHRMLRKLGIRVEKIGVGGERSSKDTGYKFVRTK